MKRLRRLKDRAGKINQSKKRTRGPLRLWHVRQRLLGFPTRHFWWIRGAVKSVSSVSFAQGFRTMERWKPQIALAIKQKEGQQMQTKSGGSLVILIGTKTSVCFKSWSYQLWQRKLAHPGLKLKAVKCQLIRCMQSFGESSITKVPPNWAKPVFRRETKETWIPFCTEFLLLTTCKGLCHAFRAPITVLRLFVWLLI